MNSRCNLQTFRGFVFFSQCILSFHNSLPIKSMLIALKRDLERVTLIGVGEISCVVERRARLAKLIMRRHLLTHVLFNAARVESIA